MHVSKHNISLNMLTLDLNNVCRTFRFQHDAERGYQDQGLCDCLEASLHPSVLLNLMINPLFCCKSEIMKLKTESFRQISWEFGQS